MSKRKDRRYQIRLEWCGYSERRWVVRFCGDWVGQSTSKQDAGSMVERHDHDRMKAYA